MTLHFYRHKDSADAFLSIEVTSVVIDHLHRITIDDYSDYPGIEVAWFDESEEEYCINEDCHQYLRLARPGQRVGRVYFSNVRIQA